jgi:AI-2 transport protein TqsA
MKQNSSGGFLKFMIGAACFVIIVAGMKLAATLLIPFLLAVFLAIILTPLYFSMMKHGISSWLAMLILILCFALLTYSAVNVGVKSLIRFGSDLPEYQDGIQNQIVLFQDWLRTKGVKSPENILNATIKPDAIISMLGSTAATFRDMATKAFIIFIIVVFLLLEAAALPDRIRQIPNIDEQTLTRLQIITENVRNYVAIKTIMSLITGGLVAGMLFASGTKNALIMGLLAFLMNYIPNVGSILASIPGILMTLVERGPGWAIAVAIGYVIINVGISNALEPRFMGKGLGLSPVIILLSMVFWAWVLGPVGMLLAVPLAMLLKIALEGFAETRGAAILMGPPSIPNLDAAIAPHPDPQEEVPTE